MQLHKNGLFYFGHRLNYQSNPCWQAMGCFRLRPFCIMSKASCIHIACGSSLQRCTFYLETCRNPKKVHTDDFVVPNTSDVEDCQAQLRQEKVCVCNPSATILHLSQQQNAHQHDIEVYNYTLSIYLKPYESPKPSEC